MVAREGNSLDGIASTQGLHFFAVASRGLLLLKVVALRMSKWVFCSRNYGVDSLGFERSRYVPSIHEMQHRRMELLDVNTKFIIIHSPPSNNRYA